jgi:hypothetical protein
VSQWAFVTAAYVVALGGTCGLVAWAYAAMRRAEEAADRLRERR